jgi:hypothetical protein
VNGKTGAVRHQKNQEGYQDDYQNGQDGEKPDLLLVR